MSKTVTRQQRWQEACRRKGLCVACGREPLLTKNHGYKCAKKIREAMRAKTGAKRRYRNARSYAKPSRPQARRRSAVKSADVAGRTALPQAGGPG